jgi:hypothetical protein
MRKRLAAACLSAAVGVAMAVVPIGPAGAVTAKLDFGFPAESIANVQAEGAQVGYSSSWAVGGDLGGVDAALDTANAKGTVPVVHWYYWGGDISQTCVENVSNTAICNGKTRNGWDAGASALSTKIWNKRQGRPAIVTLELEFHNNNVHTYEPLDGYLANQATLLRGAAAGHTGISVALGWGEWADQDGAIGVFDRAQAASDYAGTEVLWSCHQQGLTKYRTAISRLVQNSTNLRTTFGKPVFVYDLGLSSFWNGAGDSAYDPVNPNRHCTDANNFEIEQNNLMAELFTRKQELKNTDVIGVVFRELDDWATRPPDGDTHKIAERWWGFRHSGVKKLAWDTVMNGIKAENGSPPPPPPPGPNEWQQEAEAFATKPVGGVCTDATASGGQCWNLWSNGSITTTTTALAAGTKQVTVMALGDPAGGVWPQMEVYVDSVQVMNVAVSDDVWRPYSAAVTLAAGTHTVEVRYTNDGTVSGNDRNLLVDYASTNPSTATWSQEAELFPTHTAGGSTPSAGASGGAYWNLWSNGYVETTMSVPYTSQHEIQVAARGDVAGGVWPQMKVYVDGTLVLTQTVGTTTWTRYPVRRVLSGGSHTLRIEFTNDAIIGSEDRNLKLDLAALYS